MGRSPQQTRRLLRNDRMKINSKGTIHGRTSPARIVRANGTPSVTKWRKDRKRLSETLSEMVV